MKQVNLRHLRLLRLRRLLLALLSSSPLGLDIALGNLFPECDDEVTAADYLIDSFLFQVAYLGGSSPWLEVTQPQLAAGVLSP